MRIMCEASLVVMLSCAIPAVTFAECQEPQDARDVVEHARKRGYLFELIVATSEGSCWVDSSGYLLFASATAASDVVCNGRIFSRIHVPETAAAPTTAPESPDVSGGQQPAAETIAAAAWTIVAIRIATPDGGDMFPIEDTSGRGRGWTFQLKAPRGGTLQYRIDTVEFKTQEECTQWRNAF